MLRIFNKKNLKIFIPVILLIVICIVVLVFVLQKPKMVRATTIKFPYNCISEIKEEDELIVRIYVNQKDSYFTNIDQITSALIYSDESFYKLTIKSINLGDNEATLYNEDYYLYYYHFSFDFKATSKYQDELKDAKLELEFVNGVKSTIDIGSLSLYRYDSDETNSISEIAITQTKTMNHYKDYDNGLYGIILGIRNLSSELEVKIKKIEVLDQSIKKIDYIKETSSITNDASLIFPNYPSIESYPQNIKIDKKSIKYIAIPIIQDNNNDIDCGRFGLRVTYEINDNGVIKTKEYYFNQFMFYDYQFSVKENKLKFYEYANK